MDSLPETLATQSLLAHRRRTQACWLSASRGSFGIPQRALLLPTAAGNLIVGMRQPGHRGGGECNCANAAASTASSFRIRISTPRWFEWSEALGDVPILLHAADKAWVQRSSRAIEFWRGDTLSLGGGVSLVRTGGHFPGSTALHWEHRPANGRGALFVGDSPQVATNRRAVSFMYSYPNYVPMRTSDVREMQERLAAFDYEDVYGYSWGRNIIGGARAAVNASFERYLAIVGGTNDSREQSTNH